MMFVFLLFFFSLFFCLFFFVLFFFFSSYRMPAVTSPKWVPMRWGSCLQQSPIPLGLNWMKLFSVSHVIYRTGVCGRLAHVLACNSSFLEPRRKKVNECSKDVRQAQQRPESPTVTLTWHACKYKVHHQDSTWGASSVLGSASERDRLNDWVSVLLRLQLCRLVIVWFAFVCTSLTMIIACILDPMFSFR